MRDLECPKCRELLGGEPCRTCAPRPRVRKSQATPRRQPSDPTIYVPRYDGIKPYDPTVETERDPDLDLVEQYART